MRWKLFLSCLTYLRWESASSLNWTQAHVSEECIAAIKRDRAAFAESTASGSVDLTTAIPHGTGQTYLRTVLVAVDHCAYHVGQIVDVRRLIGAWKSDAS